LEPGNKVARPGSAGVTVGTLRGSDSDSDGPSQIFTVWDRGPGAGGKGLGGGGEPGADPSPGPVTDEWDSDPTATRHPASGAT
jgi:hypothetical protein